MRKKQLNIEYREYLTENELPDHETELLSRAAQAAHGAYSPYSGFNVGAAVELDNGEIITASNQENAAYPSGLCAERVAIFYAHARYPDAAIKSVAVTALQEGITCEMPTLPCGACRQVMAESELRSGKPIKIVTGGSKVTMVMDSVEGLLPFPFNNLPKKD